MTNEQATRKAGRPRSAESHQAIISATLELLAEEGFEAMSIEGIAARAGVGKTTIYRRWPSKNELVVDALDTLRTDISSIDTGSLRSDLFAILRNTSLQNLSLFENLTLKMIGELRTNSEIYRVFHARLIAPRMQQFTQMVERAKARGELPQDIDPLLIVDLIAGPLFFRSLFSSFVAQPSPDLLEHVIDAVLYGILRQHPVQNPAPHTHSD